MGIGPHGFPMTFAISFKGTFSGRGAKGGPFLLCLFGLFGQRRADTSGVIRMYLFEMP